ncbi:MULTISPECIES: electron transport complex subunit RsxC [Clostridium]|uniref:electron transport complex subunit RsxC n=1 Tax=Clostridium TaxID=1485 RepID=UPI0011DD4F19|nr:electron transport complex subunit RsxC [Clostridium disporicum]MCD2502676.1 electron transport complex subunit RsxC [Clostridium sp. NSJ-145]MDU6340597.1 electron transport complex subunit RsxC [Clostridium sp.]
MGRIKSTKSLRGIFVKHLKNTAEEKTVSMPVPSTVTIPMSMHIGAPCEPLVKMGDLVKVGQKIGESNAPFSAPIHASVSGKVKQVTEFRNALGMVSKAVVIESDGEQAISEEVKVPVVNSREEFIAAVKESGVVGLGGAGFPTHIKLNPKNLDQIDTLVINAAECEPYITSDYRECMESPEDIIEGINVVKKWLNIKNAYIGIESNKPASIKLLGELSEKHEGIDVVELKAQYPQGAEKVIIYSTTGRIVNDGQLPADAGVIVLNVTTVSFIAKYLKTGMPLVSKRLTVDGTGANKGMNVIVPLGTPIKDVFEFCGGLKADCKKILMGGPMMGIAVPDLEQPIVKNNNAIIALNEKDATPAEETDCIRCGKCVYACPLNLMPAALEKAYDARNAESLVAHDVNLCMNCGCCSYVCPAKRNLAQKNQLAKMFVRQAMQK